jgi:hypothetical protein
MKLKSGLRIPKAKELILGFVKAWYPMYDGVEVAVDNELRVTEIALSVMLNSQISGNTGGEIYNKRKPIQKALKKIPVDVDLLSIPIGETIPGLGGIAEAVDEMCSLHRVKLSVSTKILHKKRPLLIPIFDSQVEAQYSGSIPDSSNMEYGEYCNAMIRLVHEDMIAAKQELLDLCNLLKKNGTPMTPLRVLNAMTWAVRSGNADHYNKLVN